MDGSKLKLISSEDNEDTDKPSPCELKCKEEQAAIKACVHFIQQQREAQSPSSASAPSSECMAPAVAAWTKCCAAANKEASL